MVPLLVSLSRLLFQVTSSGDSARGFDGPAVLCANHVSLLDPLWVLGVLPDDVVARACVLVRGDATHPSLLRLLRSLLPIIDVSRARSATGTRRALQHLKDGGVILLHPEGRRSTGDQLLSFHSGVAWLTSRSGAQVIPVGVSGSARVLPRGAMLPRQLLQSRRRPHGSVAFGTPVPAPPRTTSKLDLNAYSRQMEAAVREAIQAADLQFERVP